jgi:hypothetical protein
VWRRRRRGRRVGGRRQEAGGRRQETGETRVEGPKSRVKSQYCVCVCGLWRAARGFWVGLIMVSPSEHAHDHDCVLAGSRRAPAFALLGTKAAAIVVPRAPCDWPPRQVTMLTVFGLGLAAALSRRHSRWIAKPPVGIHQLHLHLRRATHHSVSITATRRLHLSLPAVHHGIQHDIDTSSTPNMPSAPALCTPSPASRDPPHPIWNRLPVPPTAIPIHPSTITHPSPAPCPYQRIHACAGSSPPVVSDLAACMLRPKPHRYR